jgi:hypothetical protein
MKVMVIFTTPNKEEECENTWGFPNIKWDSKNSWDKERRLVVYNGYKIYDNDRDHDKFAEFISKESKKIINSTDTDGEFLILVHAKPKDMLNKISLNSSTINNKKIYILDSHPYEEKGLIDSLATAIKKNDRNGWIQPFDNLWTSCIKGESQEEINEILRLFLPLDIDMQALEILAKKKENRKKVKDPKEYLEEMYADNIDYIQKLKELQAKVNTIGEIEEINKERLKKLAGISNEKVSQFFKKLGGKKNDSDEFLDHFWGIDGVNSFHDWYCVLSSCLRGVEAYKGK